MNPVTLELDVLYKLRNGIMKQLDMIDKRISTLKTDAFKCELCNLVFKTEEQYDKHMVSKKHNDKIGVAPIKCSYCTNNFYGNDLTKHVLDGRCQMSRTCSGCRVVFDTMMSKSRHECSKRFVDEDDNTENITKKKKLKIKTKTKAPSPIPMPEPVAPPPEPEPVPVNSLFKADPIKYKLRPIPASCNEITPAWYEDLHYGMNKKDIFWEDMEAESSAIDSSYEDFPMFSKGNIIYYKDDNTEAFKIDYNGGKYYKLICLYKEEVEEVEATIIDNLECLSTLGEKNMTEELYQCLHKHHNLGQPDFLPAEFHRKFNANCVDIMDVQYQAGEYLFYDHNGYLCRGKEKLFKFFKHSSGLFYDMEPCETNECDSDYAEELIEEFENDDNYN